MNLSRKFQAVVFIISFFGGILGTFFFVFFGIFTPIQSSRFDKYNTTPLVYKVLLALIPIIPSLFLIPGVIHLSYKPTEHKKLAWIIAICQTIALIGGLLVIIFLGIGLGTFDYTFSDTEIQKIHEDEITVCFFFFLSSSFFLIYI